MGVLTFLPADGGAALRQQQNACYPAQFTSFLTRRIRIFDSVVRGLPMIVRRPLAVCAPATVDGAPPADPSLYLTCYEVRTPTVGKRYVGVVSNTFGTVRLILDSTRSLCVSASMTSTPAGPVRLTCYAVISPANDRSTDRTIRDTFGTSRESVAIGRPLSFCAQSKGGSAPPLYLMCYPTASQITARGVVLTDEWSVLRASPGQRDSLCVRSSLRSR